MNFIDNDPKQVAIRKYQNTLIVVGTGIIFFGVWTVVKMLGSFFILKEETVAALRKISRVGVDELSDDALFYISLVAVMIIMLVILAIRAYVGMSAISEGRGNKRHGPYLLLAVIMIISGVISFIANFFRTAPETSMGAFSADTTISGIIIELTSVIMLTEMMVSAVRIRKLKRPVKKDGGR